MSSLEDLLAQSDDESDFDEINKLEPVEVTHTPTLVG
jgi:hypothetical protein